MKRDTQIAEEAAGWIDRLNQPVFDAAAGPEFDAWMAASPRHRETFADLQALWQSEALAEALRPPEAVVELPPMSRVGVPRRRYVVPGLAAAACAALAAVVILPFATTTAYRTGVGGGKAVVLADGSRIDLSGDSELRVQILPWARKAELVRGEAFFDVRHENARTFEVASGGTAVRVLGTAFNVDRQGPARTVVAVYRGAVDVAVAGEHDLVLRKGDAAHVVDGHIAAQPRTAETAPAWKSGWFEASNVPLGVLIDKLQRYSARPILVEDRALLALPISGRFRISDTGRALQAVQVAYGVAVSYDRKAISIRPTDPVANR
ncbi:FecR domain-containing protein [Sphingomonas sp. PsM26]|nr:FecR domain-containing protein [Sphingomonas sp. PsM26]